MGRPPLTMNAWLRYDVIVRLLAARTGTHSILEIGAGGGALGSRLAERYEYVGLEPDADSFATASRRLDASPGAGTVLTIPAEDYRPDRLFDVVAAFEVLEHIEDDVGALLSWHRFLKPNGSVLLSVPAWRSKWGALDEKAGHVRRYDPSDLERVLRSSGFGTIAISLYGFPLGYVLKPMWDLLARRERRRGATLAERTSSSGRWLQPPDAAAFVTQVASAPFRRIQRPFSQRVGTGLVCLAQLEPSRTLPAGQRDSSHADGILMASRD
jgi:SAM-dependent methyltransferase